MLFLIWAIFSVRGNSVAAVINWRGQNCQKGFCITLSERQITAEAGLSVVIPCSFTHPIGLTPHNIFWYKCEPIKQRCDDSDLIFSNMYDKRVVSGYHRRVLLLEPDLSHRNCSVIIYDLTESDSGSYQVSFNGVPFGRASVSVKVSRVQHCGTEVLPWAVAGVSLSVNVFYTIFVIFLRKARKKKEVDRIYMSLQKTDTSPEYDVINQPLK